MGYLRYLRPALIAILVLWAFFLIHPFTKEAVVIKDVEYPASLVLRQGDLVNYLNGNLITSVDEFYDVSSEIKPNDTVEIIVLRETFPYNYRSVTHLFIAEEKDNKTNLGIIVDKTRFSNLRFSYSLSGGNKIVVQTNQSNAVDIIKKRLTINKIHDFSVYKENGNVVILTSEVKEKIIPLIETKGELVAKIGNETFFTTDDIEDYCVSGVNCVMHLYPYANRTAEGTEVVWNYGFQLSLNKEAGERFVDLTKNLSIKSCHLDRCLLNATIDYYIDGKLIGKEEIYAESKALPYYKPIFSGQAPTRTDAEKRLRFAQSIVAGKLNAKVVEVSEIEPLHPNAVKLSFSIWAFIIIFSSALAFFLLKKSKVFIASLALGFSEMAIVVGTISGFNAIVSLQTLIGFILAGVATFAYQFYIVRRVKKEGAMKSKLIEISKKLNVYLLISIAIFGVLVFILPRISGPVLIGLATILVLTKNMFIRIIEKISL
ncbi:MAG: hypothetical protein J7K22_02015 [Nanoarchaeota archaeon]|nr:hypothetical protein [Nanoarchaeota archaeon]